MKLTTARIAALSCPSGKRDAMWFDDEQRGLGVRVTVGGNKTFIVQYTFQGRKRRVPLGSCDALPLARARNAAAAIMGEVAKGLDPATQRKEAAAATRRRETEEALTLDVLLSDWRALHLSNKRPTYAAEAVRAVRTALGNHLELPAAALDRAIIVRVLDRMARDGRPQMAARTAAYGKAAYSWAVKRGVILQNPFTNLPVAPPSKRERVLSDHELACIWRATEEQSIYNGIIRALILTGQRRDEVAGMGRDELSADLSTWTIPGARAKNGVASVVPLSTAARALLRSYLATNEDDESLVFCAQAGAFNGWSKAKTALDARSGVSNWRLHDIRRTVATGLQRLGVRLEVTESVLNHIAGSRAGIIGIYQRHNWAREKEAALSAWAAHVIALVDGNVDAANNVVSFVDAKAAP